MGGSFAARLIVPLTLAAALVLGLGLTLDYRLARARILDRLETDAGDVLKRGSAGIESRLAGIESSDPLPGRLVAELVLEELGPLLDDRDFDAGAFVFLLTEDATLVGAPRGRLIRGPIADVLPALDDGDATGWRLPTGGEPLARQARCPGREETCELRVAPAGAGGWSVGMVFDPAYLLEPLRDYARRTALVGLVLFALLLAIVVVVTRRLTQPLPALTSASQAIADGDLDVPLPEPQGEDEVSALVRAFDRMRTDLGQHIDELCDATARRTRADAELAAARDIQRAMLPGGGSAEFTDPRAALYATLRPAQNVGGDLYSFESQQGALLFAIGDVPAQGIPAALFMARAMGLIQQWEVQRASVPPDIALAQLNAALARNNDTGLSATLILGILDLERRELCWASAGHAPPLLLRDGGATEVNQRQGTALGLHTGVNFEQNTLQLARDDRLLFFTDGLVEAQNDENTAFGVSGLVDQLEQSDDLPMVEAARALAASVEAFAGAAPVTDDMALLILEIPGQQRAPLQLERRGFRVDDTLGRAAADWLGEQWQSQGLWREGLADMQLVLEEIVDNVREHGGLSANASLALSLERFDDRVELECADPGPALDPLRDGEPGDPDRHRITGLTDAQFYRHLDGRNILRVRRYLPEHAATLAT